MSVQILGGIAKGLSLKVPKNQSFRPTLSTLKRKVFDRYQNLEGITFVDCFAGSGAIGLEALSRGAQIGIFFEKNFKHYQFLKENVDLFNNKYQSQLEYKIKLNNEDFLRSSYPFVGNEIIFFIDPPYAEKNLYFKSLEKVKLIQSDLWIEGDSSKGVSAEEILENSFLKSSKNFKIYNQGTHFIICIER